MPNKKLLIDKSQPVSPKMLAALSAVFEQHAPKQSHVLHLTSHNLEGVNPKAATASMICVPDGMGGIRCSMM
jgi:hypothetical protein